MSLFTLALVLFCAGIFLWLLGRLRQQYEVSPEIVVMKKHAHDDTNDDIQQDLGQRLQVLQSERPDIIPPVPEPRLDGDFRGWFQEAKVWLEGWAVSHRSEADISLSTRLQ